MKTKINKNKFQKGFTLIELLVVIAIIGILASVLLVNLASTRNRAKDSAIKLELSQIRSAVENFSLSNNTYVGSCGTNTDCASLQTDIVAKGGGTVVQNFSVRMKVPTARMRKQAPLACAPKTKLCRPGGGRL